MLNRQIVEAGSNLPSIDTTVRNFVAVMLAQYPLHFFAVAFDLAARKTFVFALV